MTTSKVSQGVCDVQPLFDTLVQSQRKATNFYSKANVKNKNREKAALLKSLPVGKKGESRHKKGKR